MRKKVLLIGGSLNQTKIMHAISGQLAGEYDCYFSPFYCDGLLNRLTQWGWLDFTILGPGSKFRQQTDAYLQENSLPVDYGGRQRQYDLFITGSDLIVQRNLRDQRVILVQEGMTDPENLMYYLVKWFRLPRFLASTSTTGLSDAYDFFCVASEGYGRMFIKKGIEPEKIAVTGVPTYDDEARHLENDFPHKHYVLVATSDARETFKFDNRPRFIWKAVQIAAGRPMIFKLHPNENAERATREIERIVPEAIIYVDGDINPMIANCDVLITQYSTVVFTGLALDKECYSYFDIETLKQLLPIQNGGTSAANIAQVCRYLLTDQPEISSEVFALAT